MRRWRVGMAACGLAAMLSLPQAARAQMDSREGIQLQNEILELRRDLDGLRAQAPRNNGGYVAPVPAYNAPGSSSALDAQLLDRVARLEDEVRSLRGRVDEADNARQRQADDFNKQLADLNFKLGNGAVTPAASTTSPPRGVLTPGPATLPQPSVPIHRTPEVAIADGNAALARRDYPSAQAAAREVLAATKGPRATDAQFLLAEAQAGQRDFPSAALSYNDTYNRNPRGGRAPDALLGLASSLTAVGEKKAACQTMDKLRAEFPTPRPDMRAAIVAARQRAACR